MGGPAVQDVQGDVGCVEGHPTRGPSGWTRDSVLFSLRAGRWVNEVRGSIYEFQTQKVRVWKVFQLICWEGVKNIQQGWGVQFWARNSGMGRGE